MKVWIVEHEGIEYEVYEHEDKKPIICDGCDGKIKKGDIYTEADAGERYCEECSTE